MEFQQRETIIEEDWRCLTFWRKRQREYLALQEKNHLSGFFYCNSGWKKNLKTALRSCDLSPISNKNSSFFSLFLGCCWRIEAKNYVVGEWCGVWARIGGKHKNDVQRQWGGGERRKQGRKGGWREARERDVEDTFYCVAADYYDVKLSNDTWCKVLLSTHGPGNMLAFSSCKPNKAESSM